MVPSWLTLLSWATLVTAFIAAIVVVADIFVLGYRQKMTVMEAVWPITALYSGPLGVAAYFRWGRRNSPQAQRNAEPERDYGEAVSATIGVSHCGAGCTLGDIIGAWLVFAFAWQILGLALPAEYIADFVVAFSLGIAFQYFAIAPMRGLGLRQGVQAAIKADALSLAAFEVGMFAWMAVVQLALFRHGGLKPDHAAYWFMMQIGMLIGFATAYPANVWLIRRGFKEAM
jgi:hypothetical protein